MSIWKVTVDSWQWMSVATCLLHLKIGPCATWKPGNPRAFRQLAHNFPTTLVRQEWETEAKTRETLYKWLPFPLKSGHMKSSKQLASGLLAKWSSPSIRKPGKRLRWSLWIGSASHRWTWCCALEEKFNISNVCGIRTSSSCASFAEPFSEDLRWRN